MLFTSLTKEQSMRKLNETQQRAFDAIAYWLGVESNARGRCMDFLDKNVDFDNLEPEDVVSFIRDFQTKECERLGK